MFLVNKVRKRGAFAKTNEAESKESSPRMMPWDDSTSDAPAAGAVVLPSSGKSARKPSATASELELPELVTLTLEEGDWGRRNNDDDVGFSAGSDMPAADALLKKNSNAPHRPLMDVIPGTIAAPAVDGEGDAPSAAWTPEMIWEWEQYQWAYQWHEWQMKQREWQSQVRQKYLEKEAKRLGNEQTKEPPVMKVKPPKVYKPSPLSRPISMSTIASTRSSMFSERESVLLDGQVFTLERSVGIDVHDDEKLDTLSFMSRARSVSSKMSRTVSHSRSISDSSIQSPSLSDNSLTVILVTSPEWAAPPDVVPCDTQTDRHFSTLPSPTRQRSVSSKADVSSFNTSSSSSRLSISSISSSATGTTFRASSFSLANPSIDSDISVLTISSIAPDGTHHSTQTATLCSPSVPLSSSPEPETYPTLPPASVEITTPSVVEQSYPVTVAHTPADKDELELRVGELVVLWKIHDDGFCYGYSVNSRLSGLFPIECVGPPQV
ncbi:hypothetical protein BC829DRAFT_387533 [Chytridium lagenaria]|nr:hypothetical protein BC829DRAFT_387533 [Chytridium lagenaria]